MAQEKIRVLVVDDHAVVRSGLKLLLAAEDDIEVVGDAGNAEQAALRAKLLQPDVVLLDVVMPGKSGIDGLPALLRAVPGAKVLILSMLDDPRYVREAFEAGARGFVLKEAAGTEVVDAVRAVFRGERYLHPALGARMIAGRAERQEPAAGATLSAREGEVLRLLALGYTNQEIARMLVISVRTAETHRAHIMRKLRLSSRAELVRYALACGLFDEPAAAEG
jgi:DNA-binding NarL/FixJ family response regulator